LIAELNAAPLIREMAEGMTRKAAGRDDSVIAEAPTHIKGKDRKTSRALLPFGRLRERIRRNQSYALEFSTAGKRRVHPG